MEPAQTAEEYAQYLVYVAHALVRRLGGEVVLTPQEVWRAARTDARWDREGEFLSIKLGADE